MSEPVETILKQIQENLTPEQQRCLAAQLGGPETDSVVQNQPGEEEPVRIEFFVERRHRSLLELAPPAPAANFFPRWIQRLNSHYHRQSEFQTYPPELKLRSNATVKVCPGVNDYLRTGYVLPLWSDFAITFKGAQGFSWECPNPEFKINTHPREQYETMPNRGFPTELKFESPWYIRTPPGYSCRMLPCYYHFEHLWDALPGLVHTDQNYSTHINTIFHVKEGQVVIPRGTPMMHIIPFKRIPCQLDVYEATTAEEDFINLHREKTCHWVPQADGYKSDSSKC